MRNPSAANMFYTLVLIAVSLLFTGCATPGKHSKHGKAQTIRVMTFNIHHGRGADERVDLERIAAVINKARPDIVGLQEVDHGVTRSGRVDQTAELARLTGMDFYFDKNVNYQGGEYGNGLLTRFSILEKNNLHYKSLHPGERRGVQHVVLDVNGRKLVFMNTHMDYRPEAEERLMNINEMEEMIKRYAGLPMIVVGDFNDDPNSRTHNRMKELFVDSWELVGKGIGYTYLSFRLHKRLDYIFVSDPKTLRPVKIKVIPSLASDHAPVVADIVFSE